MREKLDSLRVGMFMSYRQLIGILISDSRITARDIQVLENLSKELFKIINNIVQVFPEEETEPKNEEIKENKNNDSETN